MCRFEMFMMQKFDILSRGISNNWHHKNICLRNVTLCYAKKGYFSCSFAPVKRYRQWKNIKAVFQASIKTKVGRLL